MPESSGVAFSAARKVGKRWLPFVRAGYSPREDSPNAAILLSGMISAGVGIDMRTSDMLGLAVTWGRPPAHAARDQLSGEAFYRLQLTHNLQISPAVQWTLHPATNLERDFIWVATALRLRLVL